MKNRTIEQIRKSRSGPMPAFNDAERQRAQVPQIGLPPQTMEASLVRLSAHIMRVEEGFARLFQENDHLTTRLGYVERENDQLKSDIDALLEALGPTDIDHRAPFGRDKNGEPITQIDFEADVMANRLAQEIDKVQEG